MRGEVVRDQVVDPVRRRAELNLELDPKSGGGQRGLAWLYLLHKGDFPMAQRYAQAAMEIEPNLAGSDVAVIAVTTWTKGWTASQPIVREWLTKCPNWFVLSNRILIVALVRKVREQGELPSLAEVLRTVEDRTWWKPWSEAVAALGAGAGPDGCTSDEAKKLYQQLVE
jgi:hypothetical protein